MEDPESSLPEFYSKGLKAMQEAEKLPRGETRQDCYNEARYHLNKALELVETLSLFSDNEVIDDISTENLKYLLPAAYLARISLSGECGPNRLETFTRAEKYATLFLNRVLRYGLGGSEVEKCLGCDTDKQSQDADTSLETAMERRNLKIEKYKKMKQLESQLNELERRLNSGQEVDQEVAREYYLNLINKWIQETCDSLKCEIREAIEFEKNRTGNETKPAQSSNPRKTITIVKDDLQKKVFGMGYPSLPTVTVDQFISKKIKDGDLAFEAHKEVYANSLQRYAEQPNLLREQEELSDEEREQLEDKDDGEELARKRRWDEFKDENPRGSGNRHNMG